MSDNKAYDKSPITDPPPLPSAPSDRHGPDTDTNAVRHPLSRARSPLRASPGSGVAVPVDVDTGNDSTGLTLSRGGRSGLWTNPDQSQPSTPRGSVDMNGMSSRTGGVRHDRIPLAEPEDDNVKLSQFGRKGQWSNPDGEQASSYRRPKPTLFDKKDTDVNMLSTTNRTASYRSSIRSESSQPDSDKSFASRVDETDMDRLSEYSLYMVKETPMQKFRYYFQHPYARLLVAYLVTFCNFLIYAEDPVAHSKMECAIPVIGNVFSFVCTKYPDNAWGLLKVGLWLMSMLGGMIVGKLLIHKLLLARLLRLKMFTKDRGSWMIMFFTVIVACFVGSWVYNLFLLINPSMADKYWISTLMGVSFSWFMKAAACGTWLGDVMTAWMVTDMMLQEKLYPNWALPVRRWWTTGWNRIILFWAINVSLTVIVVTVITTDYISWDKLNYGFIATTELSRSFLASFILVMDLLIVMQDWDFPHFMNNMDLKLPGVNVAHIDFNIPKCLRKDKWSVHISGKWFNYGIIFMVMLLDLNMWKNQIFYTLEEYGQYVDADRKLISVRNETQLAYFNTSQITYDYRNNTINPDTGEFYILEDLPMNSQYEGYPMQVVGLAFLPSLLAFATFGTLVYMFGRFKPSKTDVFAGRLKKKERRRGGRGTQSSQQPATTDGLKQGADGNDNELEVYMYANTVIT